MTFSLDLASATPLNRLTARRSSPISMDTDCTGAASFLLPVSELPQLASARHIASARHRARIFLTTEFCFIVTFLSKKTGTVSRNYAYVATVLYQIEQAISTVSICKMIKNRLQKGNTLLNKSKLLFSSMDLPGQFPFQA